MVSLRLRSLLALATLLLAACASAEDRFNEGISLQAQGRFVQAVYRYADAVEKDAELVAARDRMLAAGDTAVMNAMDEADALERRGNPVDAAARYVEIDRMLSRIRQVGARPILPADYSTIRRAIFDTAIDWQMVRGDEATEEGRWEDARAFYVQARSSYLPSRAQVEESVDAETRLLLRWAEIEIQDGHPRSAFDRAEEALGVRRSPARETVLAVREIQDRALGAGTVVVAVAPVTAEPAVRDWLGGEFEVALDGDLALHYWTEPPLFIEMADAAVLRTELRGLLRGRATQSPMLVGRALDLIGADLGVLIRVASIDVVEDDVDRNRHEAVVERNARPRGPIGRRPTGEGTGSTDPQGRPVETVTADTVTYYTVRGTMVYEVVAEIVIVDTDGREVTSFTASSIQEGPFERGEFDGDPRILTLEGDRERYFDPAVLAGQMAEIERAVLEELAVAIATGTFDQVLAGIP